MYTTVKDKDTGETLPGATITFYDGDTELRGLGLTTDTAGKANVPDWGPDIIARFSFVGYTPRFMATDRILQVVTLEKATLSPGMATATAKRTYRFLLWIGLAIAGAATIIYLVKR